MATLTKKQAAAARTMISARDLSVRWGVHYRTILERVDDGRIPAVRVGRAVRIPMSWVEKREALAETQKRGKLEVI